MDKELYKKVVEHFGIISQTDMAIEECAELIVAIRHGFRNKATKNNIASEIADVEIMCGQLRYIIGNDIVDQYKQEKIIRLKKLLKDKS